MTENSNRVFSISNWRAHWIWCRGRAASAQFLSPSPAKNVSQSGSPYFSFYVLAPMYKAGRHEQALQYIRQHWGGMLDWGATTWWEMWQPVASFCHGWSAAPTHDMRGPKRKLASAITRLGNDDDCSKFEIKQGGKYRFEVA